MNEFHFAAFLSAWLHNHHYIYIRYIMKIAVLAHLKHPIRKPFMGGLEAFTYEVTKLLLQRGHEVTLFASEHSDPTLNVHAILSDVDYDMETLSRCRSHELSEDFISTHHAYLELM